MTYNELYKGLHMLAVETVQQLKQQNDYLSVKLADKNK